MIEKLRRERERTKTRGWLALLAFAGVWLQRYLYSEAGVGVGFTLAGGGVRQVFLIWKGVSAQNSTQGSRKARLLVRERRTRR